MKEIDWEKTTMCHMCGTVWVITKNTSKACVRCGAKDWTRWRMAMWRTGRKGQKLTQKRLKQLLHYNKQTGIFTWLAGSTTIQCGSIAGSITKRDGYVKISVDCNPYLAHRLAFLWVCGYLPENPVDHIDRNPSNNAWSNLREVSHSCNMRNMHINQKNTTGVKGVRYSGKKYVVSICGKYVGTYGRLIDAAISRYKEEVEMKFSDCDKNSTALGYIAEHLNEW